MRIVCTSDTHGLPLPAIPPCDLLIVAGDVEDIHLDPHDSDEQRRYLEHDFASWLRKVPARHTIGIAGNHDFEGLREPDPLRDLPWTYLRDETVEVDGLVIHGSPWTPPFREWAFMLPEDELAAKWELVPDQCDVLVTHGPPYGVADLSENTYGDPGRDLHQGSKSLRSFVGRHEPLRLHVFGHIHESHGQGTLPRDGLASLRWLNCTRTDSRYRVAHDPIVIEL